MHCIAGVVGSDSKREHALYSGWFCQMKKGTMHCISGGWFKWEHSLYRLVTRHSVGK